MLVLLRRTSFFNHLLCPKRDLIHRITTLPPSHHSWFRTFFELFSNIFYAFLLGLSRKTEIWRTDKIDQVLLAFTSKTISKNALLQPFANTCYMECTFNNWFASSLNFPRKESIIFSCRIMGTKKQSFLMIYLKGLLKC